VKDLLGLNPDLRKGGPLVPAGTEIVIYNNAKR